MMANGCTDPLLGKEPGRQPGQGNGGPSRPHPGSRVAFPFVVSAAPRQEEAARL